MPEEKLGCPLGSASIVAGATPIMACGAEVVYAVLFDRL